MILRIILILTLFIVVLFFLSLKKNNYKIQKSENYLDYIYLKNVKPLKSILKTDLKKKKTSKRFFFNV